MDAPAFSLDKSMLNLQHNLPHIICAEHVPSMSGHSRGNGWDGQGRAEWSMVGWGWRELILYINRDIFRSLFIYTYTHTAEWQLACSFSCDAAVRAVCDTIT